VLTAPSASPAVWASELGAGQRRLLHSGYAERVERRFKLAHRDVRDVADFPTARHKALRYLARYSDCLKDRCRQYRAVVEMCAYAPDQVCAALWTQVFPAGEQV
jgi:hypothetical protein